MFASRLSFDLYFYFTAWHDEENDANDEGQPGHDC
jgi:hypothetical protein